MGTTGAGERESKRDRGVTESEGRACVCEREGRACAGAWLSETRRAATYHRVQLVKVPGQGKLPWRPASHPDAQVTHADALMLRGREKRLEDGHTRQTPAVMGVPHQVCTL